VDGSYERERLEATAPKIYEKKEEEEAVIFIKSKEDIDIMRKNGKLLDEVHELVITKDGCEILTRM